MGERSHDKCSKTGKRSQIYVFVWFWGNWDENANVISIATMLVAITTKIAMKTTSLSPRGSKKLVWNVCSRTIMKNSLQLYPKIKILAQLLNVIISCFTVIRLLVVEGKTTISTPNHGAQNLLMKLLPFMNDTPKKCHKAGVIDFDKSSFKYGLNFLIFS